MNKMNDYGEITLLNGNFQLIPDYSLLTTKLDYAWDTNAVMACKYDEPREVIIKNIKAISCPCCGAPISKSINHNCSYCGTFLSLEKEEI